MESGVVELRGEIEVFLEDILLAMDECEEKDQTKWDGQTEIDRHLLEASLEVRAKVVGRERPREVQEYVTGTNREGGKRSELIDAGED